MYSFVSTVKVYFKKKLIKYSPKNCNVFRDECGNKNTFVKCIKDSDKCADGNVLKYFLEVISKSWYHFSTLASHLCVRIGIASYKISCRLDS